VSFRCCRSEADESGSEALVWAWSAPAAVANGLREIFSDLRQNKTKEEDLTKKHRCQPGNNGGVSVRQGEEYDRANGAESGDRENAVGNAKRFEFDRAVAFVLVFRTRAYCERDVRHALEQNYENGCGDERSEHRASEKTFGSEKLQDEA